MLPQSIISKILAKYGKETVYAADCAPLAAEIGVSETTVKRMLGLVGQNSAERNRTPHNSTMDLVARWLGYDSYRALLGEMGEGDLCSEFAAMEIIETHSLSEGTRIQFRYEPSRVIVMTYMGNDMFMVNSSKNSKLLKDDVIRLTQLVIGQEFIVTDVVRGGESLGVYRGAKNGGLTSLEILV